MNNSKDCNCATCNWLIKGRLCKKLSTLINERDMQGNLKCKYYNADNTKKG